MESKVNPGHYVLIKIEGMHCHKCDLTIQKALQKHPGVHEAEVDFATGQASVLFDHGTVTVGQLMDSVRQAGYKPTGYQDSGSPP